MKIQNSKKKQSKKKRGLFNNTFFFGLFFFSSKNHGFYQPWQWLLLKSLDVEKHLWPKFILENLLLALFLWVHICRW